MKPSESNTTLSHLTIRGRADRDVPDRDADHAGGETMDGEVRRIMAEVMARRARGEVLSDDRVLDEHPDLRTQLAEELDGLRMLRNAFLAAQKAGPLEDPITPIAPADLDAPIEPPPDLSTAWDDPKRPLHVQGYQVLAEISRGGQATVFKAIQEVTGRRVAIKVLTGGALAGSRHRARFEREAQALALLDHPNVVGILDRGRTLDGSFFLVMPFIDGCPLDEYASESQLADADFPVGLIRTFVKIANAVHEAHRLKIIHRDLKPSNIRIDSRGEPHVLDFGLARILDSDAGRGPDAPTILTMANQVVGSLPWASPEQAGGDSAQVDARGDVYALGVCLYQCLTGRFPYPINGSMTDTVRHITTTPAAPLEWSSVRFDRVGDLETVLAKALAKTPSNRYPSAAEFASDLEALIRGRAVSAQGGLYKAPKRWLKPLLWGTAACCVLGAAWTVRRPIRPALAPVTVLAQSTHTNSLGIRMVRIPAGRFMMGSPQSLPGRGSDEQLHPVRITRDFWIADREVTRGQWRAALMPFTPESVQGDDNSLPVTGVTWYEAREFCKRLTKREGRQYRLPTEAQWEYACQAGTWHLPFAGSDSADRLGWHNGLTGLARLHVGALKEPNSWGLFDFHGNVAEWCYDVYLPQYPVAKTDDPFVGGADLLRVVRGGSFNVPAIKCRSAARDKHSADNSRPDIGFRVVIDEGGIGQPE